MQNALAAGAVALPPSEAGLLVVAMRTDVGPCRPGGHPSSKWSRGTASSQPVAPAETSKKAVARAAQAKKVPVAGPRHLAFHPKLPIVWVLNELNSTIATYRFDPQSGSLKPLQVITTLPTDFTGYSTGAEIWVDTNPGAYAELAQRHRTGARFVDWPHDDDE